MDSYKKAKDILSRIDNPIINALKEKEWEDDTVHLLPYFTSEERDKFIICDDIMVLHVELIEKVKEADRPLCGIKYGESISRDILVPFNLPLHNLHYVINQAFGFTNSHLHEFTLTDSDLEWVTNKKVKNWKKLIGIIFKNPIRDEDVDFWDDDYTGGSPKKWMRSKYTGPNYNKCYEEGYRYIREEIKDLKVGATSLNNLYYEFENNPFALNEAIELDNIFSLDECPREPISEFYSNLDDYIKDADKHDDESLLSQPWVDGFVNELEYSYDFGDSWSFLITAKLDIEYLLKDKRVTVKAVKEAIKKVCTLARPVIIASDGYPLIDDVGGLKGYIEFLKEIENGNEELISWSSSKDWKKKIDKNAL